MRWGLGISLFVHTAILLAAVVVLPSPHEYEVDNMEAIPIDIVDIEDVSQRVAQAPDAPEEVKEPANKPLKESAKVAPSKPAPPQSQTVMPPPSAEEENKTKEIEDQKKVAEKVPDLAEPKPEEAEKKVAKKPAPPKPRAKPKPPKRAVKKHKFNPDDIAALLNKQNSIGAQAKETKKTGTPRKAKTVSRGTHAKLSANEIDWLRQRVSKCWNPPIGVVNADRLRVTLDIRLSIEGYVTGQPKIVAMSDHPLVNVAAESVVRAVMRCQPYDRLNKLKYKSWERIRMNFDLRDMVQS